MLWPSDLARAVAFQNEARQWYIDAINAEWLYRATGFYGYFWQWGHFIDNANECAREARIIMRITDETL